MNQLVTTTWLAQAIEDGALDAGDIVLLDSSAHLPATGRDAAAEFAAGHIPGAQFLDLKTLADTTAPIDNTVPTPAQFEARVRALGVSDETHVVLYDDSPLHSAARGWFLFALMGCRSVSILDGGMGKWKAECRAETQDITTPAPGNFTAQPHEGWVKTKADILAALGTDTQIVDARSAGRFTGSDPEPRPGMSSGHIPGSRNLPIGLLFEDDGTMKNASGIEAEFIGAGVDIAKPVITSCGSGVTAAVLSFALTRLGQTDIALYDGSWSEWGADPDTPKEDGPAGAPHLG